MTMKIALIAVILVASTHRVQASTIDITMTDVAGGTAFSLYLYASVAEEFNTFKMVLTPKGSAAFVNPRTGLFGIDVAGTNNTFVNPLLSFPPAIPGAHGLTIPSQAATENQVLLEAGLLGSFINASSGIFLANIVLAAGDNVHFHVSLENAGVPIAPAIRGYFLIPEPGTLALVGMSLIGLLLRRRNG